MTQNFIFNYDSNVLFFQPKIIFFHFRYIMDREDMKFYLKSMFIQKKISFLT